MQITHNPHNVGTGSLVGTGAPACPCGAKLRYLIAPLLISLAALAQEQPPQAPPPGQPQVRVNYLNVCNPSEEEQQIIRKSLASVPPPKFAPDFEISRGQTTVPDSPTANYVRIRHEFPQSLPFIAAQYSLSVDEKSIVEDLVFRSRDPKDVIQVQLEDTVTGAQDAKSVLATDTPVNRIKLERFGKPSVVLARCQGADQTVYEPLFQMASELMTRYRTALGTKRLIPRELAALGVGRPPTKSQKTAPTKKR
ncbi:MAG: hypothetical protein ACXVZV_12400 [Terriglobales bacterium]